MIVYLGYSCVDGVSVSLVGKHFVRFFMVQASIAATSSVRDPSVVRTDPTLEVHHCLPQPEGVM